MTETPDEPKPLLPIVIDCYIEDEVLGIIDKIIIFDASGPEVGDDD